MHKTFEDCALGGVRSESENKVATDIWVTEFGDKIIVRSYGGALNIEAACEEGTGEEVDRVLVEMGYSHARTWGSTKVYKHTGKQNPA